jgi:hypothetical protein
LLFVLNSDKQIAMHNPLSRVTAALMAISSCLTAPLYSAHKNGPASAISQAETDRPKTIVDQSIFGGVYRSVGDTLL